MNGVITLYSIGRVMEQAYVKTVTSSATGYPKERMTDFDLMTAWKPTTTADQTIIIDLGSVKSIDGLALFIKNYNTDQTWGGASYYKITHSADDVTYTTSVNHYFTPTIGKPIWFSDVSDWPVTNRYIKLQLFLRNVIIEIAGIFLYTKHILQASEWPHDDAPLLPVLQFDVQGGSKYAVRLARRANRQFSRRFDFVFAAEFAKLKAAYDNSFAVWSPLIYQEGSSDPMIVRFADPAIPENQYDFEMYQPSARFVELPYIEDGQVF